jgi:hypothetical protein
MTDLSDRFSCLTSKCFNPATHPQNSGFATLRVLLLLLALLLGACALTAAFQGPARGGSPHGNSIKTACSKCHASGKFIPIRPSPDFDHRSTGFPLEGMHAGLYCRDCHSSLVFSDIGTECSDCHADIHHRSLGADCEGCHTIRGWDSIKRNVSGHTNRFPLLGAHVALECESCHTSAAVGQFRGLRTDCDSCHHNDYLNAESVDHVAAGFSLNCELCHGMDGWLSRFNHGGVTGFALSGAHMLLDCRDCHTNLVFEVTPADCYACHVEEYNNTTDPGHSAAGFSQDCSQCHTASTWVNAFFDHNGTQFPLTGAHVQLDCQACHSSGQYAGLAFDCYACHSGDYNNTTDPAHIAAGFPQDCSQCHTTSGWGGAEFTHPDFPIYTGTHSREWTACSDCHTNPGNYAVFTCVSCHSKEETDGQHHDVTGYVYNSSSCYSCHPTGRGED